MISIVDQSETLSFFFDIDGTLIDSGGAGGGALLDALRDVFDVSDAKPVPLHGRTDLGIMSELLESHDVPATAENVDRLSSRYFDFLPDVLQKRTGSVLPGVHELLSELQGRTCDLGLMTGNMPQSAQMKLEHYDLWQHFEFGVYGDRAMHRHELAATATATLREQREGEFQHERVIIVGDTPLDVDLAQRMRVRCLAVATGGFSAGELRDAGATWVCDDLSATEEVLEHCFETTQGMTCE